MVCSLLTGCGSSTTKETEGTATGNTDNTNAKEPTKAATENIGELTIGFSTGASGTAFRTILENDFKTVADEYKAAGRLKDYKIVNNVTNWDASEQANIIRDFINDSDIDVIMVNPNSPTDLNGVLAEAVAAGKQVVVLDCEVDVDGVLCVSIDHYNWSKKAAEWICNELGSGTAIQIYGGDGHPANNDRINGTYDTLKDYPDIDLIADTTGGWDNQVAKEATTQILGSGVNVDAVFTQDSMAAGVLSAFMDLNKVPKVMFGELGTQFIKEVVELKEKGTEIKFCTQPNPPGIAASALRLAVNVSEGKEFKDGVIGGHFGNGYYYPVNAWYTQDNLDELQTMIADKADDWLYSEYLTEDQALKLFK